MAGSTTGPKADAIAAEQLNIQDWVKGLAAIPATEFSRNRTGLHSASRRPPRNHPQVLLLLKRQLHPQPDFQK